MIQNVALRECTHKGWRAWSISRGLLEIVLVPQIGGRIMGLLWRGQDLTFTQPQREGQVPSLDSDQDVLEQKRALGFPLWGGDKTWIAPQSHWNEASPYLDLDSGPYEFEISADSPDRVEVVMLSRVCRETGLRIRRTVTVAAADAHFSVRHEVQNVGARPTDAEIWDVAMLMTPAEVYLPTWRHSGFPAGVKTYASEGQSEAVRNDVVHSHDGYAVVSCGERIAFKYGVDGPEGWIAAVLKRPDGGLVGYRKSMPVFLDQQYAHGCVVEVYQSDAYGYLEMEIHGPSITLRPGERFAIDECHSIADVAEIPGSLAQLEAVARP